MCEGPEWVWLGPVWVCEGPVWVWAARLSALRVWVSVPPESARVRAVSPDPVPVPIGVRPRRSGRLNVVDPFPAPHVVPIAANSRA